MDLAVFGKGDKNLVIIPGLSVTPVTPLADAVEKQYSTMTDEYRIILADRRKNAPHGYSLEDMAHDTHKALSDNGISTYSVAGISQGGMIAMYMAVDFAYYTEKLILCSTAYRITDTFRSVNAEWKRLAREKNKKALAEFFGKAVYSESIFRRYKDSLVSDGDGYTDRDLEHFLVMADAFDTLNISERLSEIRCPVFVLGSEGDRVFGTDSSRATADKLGCERYIYGKEYGHAVYDEAEDFIGRMYGFLKK